MSVEYDETGNVSSVNGFEVQKKLGQGGYGTTFLSEKDGRYYVIKTMRKEDAVAEYSELKDIGLSCRTHMNCPVDLVITDGEAYLITEYIPGKDLSHYEEKTMPEEFYYTFFVQMLQALSILHKKKIYHRDIKPNNIMYVKETNDFYLIDFGVAHTEGKTKMDCVGTPLFIAPVYKELCRTGHVPLEDLAYNDMFALAVTAFLIIEHTYPYEIVGDSDYDFDRPTDYKNATDFQSGIINSMFEGVSADEIIEIYNLH
jgi:serine/threonine protein kinase